MAKTWMILTTRRRTGSLGGRRRVVDLHQVLREHVLPPLAPSVVATSVRVERASPPHGHGFIELVVVSGGRGVHCSAAGEHPLRRGSVALTLPGEWHGFDRCRELDVWNLYLAPEAREREISGLRSDALLGRALWGPIVAAADRSGRGGLRQSVGRVDDSVLSRVEQALRRLAEDPSESLPGASVVRIGLLLEVLGEVVSALVAGTGSWSPTRGGWHPALLVATRLLEERFEEPWTLRRLADEVHLSPAYLVRLFTQQLGSPPMAYLNRLRAERAAVMLVETASSVAQIGRAVGWPDPSHASRRFASVLGRSPRAYRQAFGRPEVAAPEVAVGTRWWATPPTSST